MTAIKFDKSTEALLCPGCQLPNLHHGTVTVFYRKREDAPSQAFVIEAGDVDASSVLRKPDAPENPSNRRGGVAIRFECEHCSQISELTIAQHKGETLVNWRTIGFQIHPCGEEILPDGIAW